MHYCVCRKLKCVKFINKTGMEIICSALERPMNRALHDLANDLTEHILWTVLFFVINLFP
jgi:hypothetical protein